MKTLDVQIQALTGKIKHHLQHDYSSDANRLRNHEELRKQYQVVSDLPISEISQDVWDEMNDLASEAMINS